MKYWISLIIKATIFTYFLIRLEKAKSEGTQAELIYYSVLCICISILAT